MGAIFKRLYFESRIQVKDLGLRNSNMIPEGMAPKS